MNRIDLKALSPHRSGKFVVVVVYNANLAFTTWLAQERIECWVECVVTAGHTVDKRIGCAITKRRRATEWKTL